MIKLLLNPTLKLGRDEDTAYLLSEIDYFRFPLAALPLLSQLQQPTAIDDIAPEQRDWLRQLGEQRLLINANCHQLPPAVVSYWLAKHYHPGFIKAQLELSVQFIGPQAAPYRARFAARYPECTVVDADGQLLVYVTHDLLRCEIDPALEQQGVPIVLIKTGGMKQSIGPVLTRALRYSELQAAISRPFDADLSVAVPDSVQDTADAILLSELYHLRVQAGLHLAINHVVEWNMARLSKKHWKVKPA
ncbi:hypothetical protein SAMN05192549_105175 [Duganella sacchari]|uniref:Uncharacterized protein n=1 Tax=Duganella sacchari TaxID=551987 RepID=A0A1M7PKM0_9BURK|nr:hypothetical protein [Duganella sacchari]SHN17767.1 hypothetical protein SAMN05192549_105175 [Duganella sacchari]